MSAQDGATAKPRGSRKLTAPERTEMMIMFMTSEASEMQDLLSPERGPASIPVEVDHWIADAGAIPIQVVRKPRPPSPSLQRPGAHPETLPPSNPARERASG
jgi:hypothetical protein